MSDSEQPPETPEDAEAPPAPGGAEQAPQTPTDADSPVGIGPLSQLDPARAIAERATREPRNWKPEPVIDTRKYQWMIGGFGFTLVVIFSIYLYVHNGITTPGVTAGKPLHKFVAPLATSDLNDVGANANPRCNPARPSRRGLNVCDREPIVLAFFTVGGSPCIHEVQTLQTVSREFPKIQFAAVAISAGREATDRLVRKYHWTIPVAYDVTGAVGEIYGVSICPMIEIAGKHGIVVQRLIGEGWESPRALAAAVARLG